MCFFFLKHEEQMNYDILYDHLYELVLLCHPEHYYWKPEMNVQTYRDTKVLYTFAKIIICCT